jgi:uncharacterized protein DUF5063
MNDGAKPDSRIEAFAIAAAAYCDWAEGEQRDAAAEARIARELVAELYRRAIDLPDLDDIDVEAPDIAQEDWQRMYRRFGSLPLGHYSECFDSLLVPAEEPVVAALADDLADIWSDVKRGLLLFRAGNASAAAWEWRFHFDIHWAHHAIGALGALQSWLTSPEAEASP